MKFLLDTSNAQEYTTTEDGQGIGKQ